MIEADVAAGLPAYSDSASAEVDVSTAPVPTGHVVDQQYGYGLFGGQSTFGCRFQADREITCSLFNASGAPGDPAVFGNEQGRVWQMLPFQHVGTTNVGGDASGDNPVPLGPRGREPGRPADAGPLVRPPQQQHPLTSRRAPQHRSSGPCDPPVYARLVRGRGARSP